MAVQPKAILEEILKRLGFDATVEEHLLEEGPLLEIRTDDPGRLIGRKGQTAQAVRTLLKIVGAKNNARVNLKIYDPEGGNRPRRMESSSSEVDTSAVDDLKI